MLAKLQFDTAVLQNAKLNKLVVDMGKWKKKEVRGVAMEVLRHVAVFCDKFLFQNLTCQHFRKYVETFSV